MREQTTILLNRLGDDQRVVAERRWRERTQARVAQAPCDHGLFSDDAKQADMFTTNTAKGQRR